MKRFFLMFAFCISGVGTSAVADNEIFAPDRFGYFEVPNITRDYYSIIPRTPRPLEGGLVHVRFLSVPDAADRIFITTNKLETGFILGTEFSKDFLFETASLGIRSESGEIPALTGCWRFLD